MIAPKAKTPGRRRFQVYDDTCGPRQPASRRNRLRADIIAKGGYDYVWDVLKPPVAFATFFKLGYRKGMRLDVLQKFARWMRPNEDPNYYVEDEVTRDSCFNIPIDRVRRVIECRIVTGEIAEVTVDEGGEAVVTNLLEITEPLLEEMRRLGYPVSASLAPEVVGDLIRDGFSYSDPDTGIARVASLSLDAVREANQGRLGFEWSYHEAVIERINAGDNDLRNRVVAGFETALVECEKLVGKGKRFSKADRAFHMVPIPLGCRVLAEPLMKACERTYMKKRRLLKALHGPGDSRYVESIKQFNMGQVETLMPIVQEYRRPKPRKTQVRKLLKAHTDLQIQAWYDCEDLMQAIVDRGETPKLDD